MDTQCTPTQLEFHAFGRRQIVGRFDAGRLTSDGGAILLREVDRRLALMQRIADCFADYRDPRKVEHSVLEMVTQRVGGIALGYEDLNDHDALRGDSLLALWACKAEADRCAATPAAGSGLCAGGLEHIEPPGVEQAGGRGPGSLPPDRGGCGCAGPGTGDCSWTPTVRRRKNCGWTWTPRTIRCTAIRRGVSFTVTTRTTVTCRSTSSTCCCARLRPSNRDASAQRRGVDPDCRSDSPMAPGALGGAGRFRVLSGIDHALVRVQRRDTCSAWRATSAW